MVATPSLRDARVAFENALLRAITEGGSPSRTGDLGEDTWSAIEAIARDHPEATVLQIAEAYDTFEQETDAADERDDSPPSREEEGAGRCRVARASEPVVETLDETAGDGSTRRPRPSRQRG